MQPIILFFEKQLWFLLLYYILCVFCSYTLQMCKSNFKMHSEKYQVSIKDKLMSTGSKHANVNSSVYSKMIVKDIAKVIASRDL